MDYLYPRSTAPCRICSAGQRLSTFVFVLFAVLLAIAAMDPDLSPMRHFLMSLCSALSGLAAIRFPIARTVTALQNLLRQRKSGMKHGGARRG